MTWHTVFRKMPMERLISLFTKPSIIQRLLELQQPIDGGNLPARSVDTVLCILKPLHRYLVSSEKLPPLFISMQRCANCSVKSVNCLLLDLLNQQEKASSYKPLSFDVRFSTLLAFFQLYREDETLRTDVTYFQIKEAALNFLRRLHVYHDLRKVP